MKKILYIFLVLIFFVQTFPIRAAELPEIKSEAYVLVDADTGQILIERNMNKKMYPASITKIMTGMLALENGKLEDVITMSYDAVFSIGRNTSHIALDYEEQITLDQALHALSMESANDAANGIAELIGGTMDDFVIMMNNKAKEVGAKDTHFVNAHGLHDKDHYTTAHDMMKIALSAIKVEGFTEIFGAKKYNIPPTNKQEETRYFANRNKLINGAVPCEGIIMSKNGWTEQATNTLVTLCERGDRKLLAVVMKSIPADDKFEDTAKLFEYGFENFQKVNLDEDTIYTFMPQEIKLSEENIKITKTDYNIKQYSLMIPKDKKAEDITIDFSKLKYNEAQSNVTTEGVVMLNNKEIEGIPTLNISANLKKESLAVKTEEKTPLKIGMVPTIIIAFIGFLFVVLCIALILSSIRKRNLRKRRRMKSFKTTNHR